MKTIKTNCTDNELSEAVARTCNGWKTGQPAGYHTTAIGMVTCQASLPSYATSFAAVSPLLMNTGLAVAIFFDPRAPGWVVELNGQHNSRRYRADLNQSLPRSCCFLLLQSAGMSVEDSQ